MERLADTRAGFRSLTEAFDTTWVQQSAAQALSVNLLEKIGAAKGKNRPLLQAYFLSGRLPCDGAQ
jgi:hypothetical protein